ncbi:SusC/RagA family TonB-linked outer membrane protein [Niabella soli]|uniref:TonB-denpendent receptor n=1 Tax=Niabella soli DSM 19437 TaxID=929713 RepID=W0F124_9BACT|nr:TonB-dependent receptor [Niabella soli]AHF15538.1 TonB-denpendent receptor [Niabella soli DSM 19437]
MNKRLWTIALVILLCPALVWAKDLQAGMAVINLNGNAIPAAIHVEGTVTDESGKPLTGINIIEKGTTRGTTTDANGRFSIEVANSKAVLVFSGVGFLQQEVSVTGPEPLSIVLQTNIKTGDEVIVVGYGTQRKRDITGAIASVSEQAIKNVPASNLSNALQGQAAGVDIQRSGANSKPGATPSILIRGSRSLGASNSPLIVVDGVPFNGSIADLNQDDVVSVEILKDASATSIYGSRGANGVLLITTKRGKAGSTPVVTYSGYIGTSKITDEFPVMNGQEFATLKKWANINANPGKYTGLDDPLFLTNGVFDPAEVEGVKTGRSTNWQQYIYKTGIITDHQVGVSAGTDKTQYAVSGGYFNQTGIYPGQSFERYSVKISVDQKLGKRIKIGLSSLNNFSTRKGESANPMAQALRASPLVSPFDSTGAVLNNFVPGSASQVWNPLADFEKNAVVETRKRLGTFTTFYGEINLLDGLKYRLNAGAEIRSDVYGNFYASKTTYNLGKPSTSSNRTALSTDYTIENLLVYEKTFAAKHHINFTGLYSLQQSQSQSNQFDNTDISADYLAFYNPVYGSNLTGKGAYSKWDILSYMGRLNYGFDNRYLLTLTMRSDGSSRLAPGNKYHVFPSASAAWNLGNEKFLKGSEIFSSLKLRAGYGMVGNTAIDPYQTLGSLSPLVYNYGSTTTTGVYPSNAPNPKLTWENTATANIGIDFSVLKDRVSGSIELYHQYTNSLLLPQTLPPTSGIPNKIVTNIGKTENKGMEITLHTENIQAKREQGFSWSSDFNFSINRGVIKQLANGVLSDVGNGWFVGSPIDVFYDYKRLGIWQNTSADSALAKSLGLTLTGTSSVIGTIKVADVSGPQGVPDGKIDATYDRIIVGTSQPKWQGGTTQRIAFKGFDFTVVAFARMGFMMNSSLYGGNFVNTYQGTYNNMQVDYWTPDNHQNQFPKPNAATTNPAYRSLLGYFDGSFIKIRTLSLGYTLPARWVSQLGLKAFRAYVTASDPFILYAPYRKAGGLDPEGAGTVGIDTPPVRSMILGVNVTF